MRRLSAAALLSLWACAAHGWGGGGDTTPGGAPRLARQHVRPELVNFPYGGRGDGHHSFHHPYYPSVDAPVSGWAQIGSAVVTAAGGRDVVRLTSGAQGLQGAFYATRHTETDDWNGYFDVVLGKAVGSKEAADGMMFFFADAVPGVGSAMGVSEKFKGLGVVIDTFSNSRSRQVPYMYAYVSDGEKTWNADTDGSDTELTKGCRLEMDTPTRVFVRLLDNNLHVAVSMNRNHNRWHTCFRYNNVPMPFSGGGFLGFSGETGHFFAHHDVHDAAFVIGDVYRSDDEFDVHAQEVLRQREVAAEQAHAAGHAGQEAHDAHHFDSGYHDARHVDEPHHDPVPPPHHDYEEQARMDAHFHEHVVDPHAAASSKQARVSADDMLEAHLDAKVHILYEEVTTVLEGLGTGMDKRVTDSLQESLTDMSHMTEHMIAEIDRQTAETADATAALSRMKQVSIDLHSYSERFTQQVSALHRTVHELRRGANVLRASQEETHAMVRGHADALFRFSSKIEDSAPHTVFSVLVFIVCQVLVVGGVAVVLRMGQSSRGKMGRMV